MTRRTDVRGGEAPTVGTDVWERACQAKAPDERHHVPGVALVFEGGGMRASYTCAIAQTLLEHGLDFDFVCGISAGSSNTVNYVSRDIWRTRVSFTDFVLDPRFGGMKTFLQGKGMFSSHWIYREAGLPDGAFPFDFATFAASPTRVAIQAFDRDTGQTVVWGKADMPTIDDLMMRVQASSSLPFVMPSVQIDGHTYYDGGLGRDGGIPIQMALAAGYERLFVVLTRPKGYRKSAPTGINLAIANHYRKYPHVREALLHRHEAYNAALERLEAMAQTGQACVVYAEKMAVESSTTDHAALVKSFEDGYEQAARQLPEWLRWLGV